jgi:hypothetical protein
MSAARLAQMEINKIRNTAEYRRLQASGSNPAKLAELKQRIAELQGTAGAPPPKSPAKVPVKSVPKTPVKVPAKSVPSVPSVPVIPSIPSVPSTLNVQNVPSRADRRAAHEAATAKTLATRTKTVPPKAVKPVVAVVKVAPKTPAKVPPKAVKPVVAVVKVASKTPPKTPAKTPAKVPPKTSAKTPAKTPAKVPKVTEEEFLDNINSDKLELEDISTDNMSDVEDLDSVEGGDKLRTPKDIENELDDLGDLEDDLE